MPQSVHPVVNGRDWNDFFNLRRKIYRSDPGVVHPLRKMERVLLDATTHPFYEHACRAAFVCRRDGQPVGRIVAIVDELHNKVHGESMGFFGFFESIDDAAVVSALFQKAEDWLRKKGCTHIRGPVNPSMKSDFGVMVQGHGDPPFLMMAYSKSYYQRLLEDQGFQKKLDFHAFLYDAREHAQQAGQMKASHESQVKKILARYPQLKIGDCPLSERDAVIREINRLGNQVRRVGFGFVPMTDSELEFMIRQMRHILRPDSIFCAWWNDQLVGYCINLPDINWALRKTWGRFDWLRIPQLLYWIRRTRRARVIAIGADERFRNKGVGALLAFEMRSRGLAMTSFDQWEFSWVAENNVRSIRNIQRTAPMRKYKTYRLYEKPLAPT